MGQEPDTTVDFGKLNAAERTALNLLARGHTAKSIATLTDRSVGAVNERLREARRKTGVGSSRELARLFAAQENRDELIEVAPASAVDPDSIPLAASGRHWKGTVLMSVTLAGAIAAIVLTVQSPPQTAPATNYDDPDAAAMSNAPNPRQLHDRVMAEKRDESWAPGIEVALGKWFVETTDVTGVARVSRIRCGDTACEIVGTFARTSGEKQINGAMQRMQGKSFKDTIAALGLKSQTATFGASNSGDGTFALFVARE